MNPMTTFKGCVFLAATALAGSSHALIAFDNFGAGDTFNTNVANPIYVNQSMANRFTAAYSGELDKITLALSGQNNLTDELSVGLYDDSGGTIGSYITSWSTTPTGIFGNVYSPRVLNNAFPFITLTAGNSYWLVAQPSDPNSATEWNFNSIGYSGTGAFSTDGGANWNYVNDARNAFRVEVLSSSVPGPAAILPFALGLVGVMRRRRR